ncbi:MAG TPA: glycosyltransferase family 9 protein [candidate division Zixibacteria bacterium]|nr:glycosyltransferase family 9 protein [candidate division Zixibacteria bacterium]
MGRLKEFEYSFKRFFYRATASLLRPRPVGEGPLDGAALRKVLFLRPDKLGDMVISFPVFDALRTRYPHLRIGVLASPRNSAITLGDPRFDEIYMYTKRAPHDLRELRRLRRAQYDCVVDLVYGDSVTTLYLSEYVARGKPRIGVGKERYARYYDFNRSGRGQILECTLQVLAAFGIDPAAVNPYAGPHLSRSDQELAAAFLGAAAADGAGSLTVGLNLSAGMPSRLWQPEKSAELAARILAARPRARIIVIVVPGDRRRGQELVQAVRDARVHLVPDGLTLRQVAAVISRLDLLVTPDTSLVHIARAFQVPVVGLYSCHERNFRQWRPYGQDIGAVVAPSEDNIFAITVDQVMAAFEQVAAGRLGVEE